MSVTLRFTNRNLNNDGIRVWRSATPFDADSLPSEAYAEIDAESTQFRDEAVSRGEEYYYLLESFKGNDRAFSRIQRVKALPILTGPGPQELIAGDHRAGFYGEVLASELMDGVELAAKIGLTAGVAFNSDTPYLKFNLGGETLFVPKRPHRHTISWDQINARNAVYGGANAPVVESVFLDKFKVRLLRGAASDPTTDAGGWDIPTTHGSEWNRLLYPIHSGVHTDTSNPTVHTDPTAAPFGSWAQYSDADLVLRGTDNGRANWCQETPATSTQRVYRGNSGVTHLSRATSSSAGSLFGWRAVLVPILDN
jgi:hypothetical protein